jgi:hypothetical protein
MTLAGQVTLVTEAAGSISNVSLSELPKWLASPGYVY